MDYYKEDQVNIHQQKLSTWTLIINKITTHDGQYERGYHQGLVCQFLQLYKFL